MIPKIIGIPMHINKGTTKTLSAIPIVKVIKAISTPAKKYNGFLQKFLRTFLKHASNIMAVNPTGAANTIITGSIMSASNSHPRLIHI